MGSASGVRIWGTWEDPEGGFIKFANTPYGGETSIYSLLQQGVYLPITSVLNHGPPAGGALLAEGGQNQKFA